MLSRFVMRPLVLGTKSVTLHKMRAFLTILGVVFGVASVMIMLAVGEGARSKAVKAIEQLGANNIIVRSVNPLDPGAQVEFGANRYGLTLRDVERLRKTLPDSATVAPMRAHSRSLHCGQRHFEGRVVAVSPLYFTLQGVDLRGGRLINQLDCERLQSVAVLGAEAARALFPIDSPVGKAIRIGDHQYFRVIGVLAPRAQTPAVGEELPAEDHGRDVYIPFPTDAKRFGTNIAFDRMSNIAERVEVSQLTLSLANTAQVQPAASVVRSLIAEGQLQDEAVITVPLDLLERAEQTQRVFNWMLTAIASISLLVGGIGIMNIMLATVTERTREIGIRRALGATRLDIVSQFLVETTVLSASGGILGVALGAIGAWVAAYVSGMPTLVQPWVPLLALAIAVGVGLIFGTYPARRAAAMDPVEALRHS